MEFGITGPAFTVATACASSAHAIGLASNMVRSGMCDVAIAGGSEATFSEGLLLRGKRCGWFPLPFAGRFRATGTA